MTLTAFAKLRKTVLGVATVAGAAYLVRTVRGRRDDGGVVRHTPDVPAPQAAAPPAARPASPVSAPSAPSPASIAKNVHPRPASETAVVETGDGAEATRPSAEDSPGGKLPPRR